MDMTANLSVDMTAHLSVDMTTLAVGDRGVCGGYDWTLVVGDRGVCGGYDWTLVVGDRGVCNISVVVVVHLRGGHAWTVLGV